MAALALVNPKQSLVPTMITQYVLGKSKIKSNLIGDVTTFLVSVRGLVA